MWVLYFKTYILWLTPALKFQQFFSCWVRIFDQTSKHVSWYNIQKHYETEWFISSAEKLTAASSWILSAVSWIRQTILSTFLFQIPRSLPKLTDRWPTPSQPMITPKQVDQMGWSCVKTDAESALTKSEIFLVLSHRILRLYWIKHSSQGQLNAIENHLPLL